MDENDATTLSKLEDRVEKLESRQALIIRGLLTILVLIGERVYDYLPI